eukprot:4595456-Prymnesium_polylepis.1
MEFTALGDRRNGSFSAEPRRNVAAPVLIGMVAGGALLVTLVSGPKAQDNARSTTVASVISPTGDLEQRWLGLGG